MPKKCQSDSKDSKAMACSLAPVHEHTRALTRFLSLGVRTLGGLICMIRAPQANRLSGQRKYHDSAGSDVSGYTLRPLFHSKDREIKAERGDEEGISK